MGKIYDLAIVTRTKTALFFRVRKCKINPNFSKKQVISL